MNVKFFVEIEKIANKLLLYPSQKQEVNSIMINKTYEEEITITIRP